MSDNVPLYEKFIVRRRDGRDRPGEKHFGCRYFVLDLDHDTHARAAIHAYAESCEDEYPALAESLRRVIAGAGLEMLDYQVAQRLIQSEREREIQEDLESQLPREQTDE